MHSSGPSVGVMALACIAAGFPATCPDVRGQERARHVFEGHSRAVRCVAFSPDGKRIVTGSWDKTARLWDAETGKEILALEGHSSMVQSVAFSPDGKSVLTGSLDGTARVGDPETGKRLRDFHEPGGGRDPVKG